MKPKEDIMESVWDAPESALPYLIEVLIDIRDQLGAIEDRVGSIAVRAYEIKGELEHISRRVGK